YFVAGVMFAITIVVSIIYFSLTQIMINSLVGKDWKTTLSINLVYGLGFGIIALFSLISIGFYRYVRFKIDLIMYQRRHGATTNTPTGETPITPTTDTPLASTGLTDNATKE
ncbi:MAG: hypothetical protein LBM72_00105, partial [Mycoplasmataceae bacterium]|nr:hypothetical protein [Mycoplasmataceae bacterium]